MKPFDPKWRAKSCPACGEKSSESKPAAGKKIKPLRFNHINYVKKFYSSGGDPYTGQICDEATGCSEKYPQHFHVTCDYCQFRYAMKTKITPEPPKPTKPKPEKPFDPTLPHKPK